jgi:hypothetical protein
VAADRHTSSPSASLSFLLLCLSIFSWPPSPPSNRWLLPVCCLVVEDSFRICWDIGSDIVAIDLSGSCSLLLLLLLLLLSLSLCGEKMMQRTSYSRILLTSLVQSEESASGDLFSPGITTSLRPSKKFLHADNSDSSSRLLEQVLDL